MPQNCAEFHIIGRVGKIDARDKVTYVDVAANYNRKDDDGQWQSDTHWNRVTCFSRTAEKVARSGKGDLVRIIGRVRQSSYEDAGAVHYGTDLIADDYSVIARRGEAAGEDDGGE